MTPSAGAHAHVPVVRIADGFARQLTDACREIGFVAVTGHGIPNDLMDAMRAQVIRVFDVDEADKRRQAITRDNYRGYIPLGFFTPNRALNRGDALEGDGDDNTADAYEGYKLHWECPPGHPARTQCALYGSNRWPAHLPALAQTVHAWWDACDRLAAQLLGAFAQEVGLDSDWLRGCFDAPLTNMTLLHYPPRRRGFGIHPHKDTCALTILHPDPAGGLELRTRDGAWIEAACPPGALLVNIGEMLELWTGGRLVATPHRATNRAGVSRYSFPWFAVPNHAVIVEPLLTPIAGFERPPMPVGHVTAEVWRTNWPDQRPSSAGYDLGRIDAP